MLKGKLDLLSNTNMVDFAMDVHRTLYPDQEVPAGRNVPQQVGIISSLYPRWLGEAGVNVGLWFVFSSSVIPQISTTHLYFFLLIFPLNQALSYNLCHFWINKIKSVYFSTRKTCVKAILISQLLLANLVLLNKTMSFVIYWILIPYL